ncbi:MAG: Na+ dependent nucleoside transporter N-terminal domain-containing protein [Syntrophaceae bacterium]|nr:Na+ dependent nucleoside transporter N-terminal domain-containing protein [Syntrophaceae bacterium]
MYLPMLQSLFGLFAFILIAWALSENRRGVSPRLVITGLVLQFVLALIFLKIPVFRDLFLLLNRAAEALEEGTRAGTTFVFGYLGGGALPFEEPYPGAAYIFAFRALPVIIVTGALTTLLYHWKIIPVLVRAFSAVLSGPWVSAELWVWDARRIYSRGWSNPPSSSGLISPP